MENWLACARSLGSTSLWLCQITFAASQSAQVVAICEIRVKTRFELDLEPEQTGSTERKPGPEKLWHGGSLLHLPARDSSELPPVR